MAKHKKRGASKNNQKNIKNQLEEHVKSLHKLMPPVCIKESKRWLEKAHDSRASSNTLATYMHASLASITAAWALDFEAKKQKITDMITSSFLEASLQKIKAHVILLISTENAVEFLKKSVNPSEEGFSAEDIIKKRDEWISKLHDVVEIAFDAEKYRHAFGIATIFPQKMLGSGVFENKERYAADVINEFKKIVKHAFLSENLLFLSDEITNKLKKLTDDAINLADGIHNREYKSIINTTHQKLSEVIAQGDISIPVRDALRNLSIFSAADNLDNRTGGAEEQKFEAEIQDLVVEYLRST